jgi:hypothetical protein
VFASSGTYWVSHVPGPGQTHAVVERATSRIGYPYSLLDHNCEHTVARAYGLRGSPQTREAALIAVVAGSVYLFTGLLSGLHPGS